MPSADVRSVALNTRFTTGLEVCALALMVLCAAAAASPLIHPKSMRQVGLPAAAAHAAIPSADGTTASRRDRQLGN